MPPILSVQQFVTLVNDTLAMIPTGAFVVEGEVTEYKVAQQKWIHFSLKDEQADARLPCFSTIYKGLPPLEDGMRVRLTGYPSVFARFGKLSFNVETAEPVGEGALAKAYLALKEKLANEGLFDAGRKRALPMLPQRIALITSREAAAYGDFLRILHNRMGGIDILHVDVHVQGQHAVEDIIGAFKTLHALPVDERPEVIVLSRGGGSFEELHAFNDERVARAVFSSAIPVIVGVGHERDETLCDFVADVRASTPSNAAERLVPHRDDMLRDVSSMVMRMDGRLLREIGVFRARVERAMVVVDHTFTMLSASVAAYRESLQEHMSRLLERSSLTLKTYERTLQNLDPQRVLARGYAIVRSADGHVIADAKKANLGDYLSVQFAKGHIEAEVVGDRSIPLQKKLL